MPSLVAGCNHTSVHDLLLLQNYSGKNLSNGNILLSLMITLEWLNSHRTPRWPVNHLLNSLIGTYLDMYLLTWPVWHLWTFRISLFHSCGCQITEEENKMVGLASLVIVKLRGGLHCDLWCQTFVGFPSGIFQDLPSFHIYSLLFL